ncbi:MAG: ImmA/IrrE family metallo-endopeptidase [Anaerovoracaceae bacterium]|nr:ImmA/IrrE family metallo-endopeptidase [Anaerovoracaceae bacterium]MDY4582908.1 ImmA/IrrE family metallo-endopeptidase [Candidatus Faecousia sp.]
MFRALENSLFIKDKKKYNEIREYALSFNSIYNGNNIIQDDIFHIVENYVRHQEMPFDFLRYPIKDEDLCACTFMREGHMFVMVNSALPLSKQIFAAAHELYHIYCYFEEKDTILMQSGSILESDVMEDAAVETEDMEANAFAGLLLAPQDCLNEQTRIYGINYNNISMTDILMLMEIFAIPYKAVILRLFEEEKITEKKVRELFLQDVNDIEKYIQLTGRSARWQASPSNLIRFGGLMEEMNEAEQKEIVRTERLEDDKNRLQSIIEQLK